MKPRRQGGELAAEGYGGVRKRRTAYRSTWRELVGFTNPFKAKARVVTKKQGTLDRSPFKHKFWKQH